MPSLALSLALTLALTLAAPAVHAAAREYSVAPIPDWVHRIAPVEAASLPSDQVSQGVHYLLSDTQTRVDAHDKLHYRHIAARALNERGVEAVAHVEIRFDPSYQTLALHMLQVRRGGQLINKLPGSKVKVLQRERELEYLIFDGSKTANVFLDDVRVGDVVEYAYSLRGSNPVFGNRHSGRVDLQASVPVAHIHTRLLWPRERPLEMLARNGAAAAVVTPRGAHLDHVWQARNVEPLRVEEDAPSWFDPYPSVQWGEFKDWQAVARWAAPYYRVPQQLSPALRAEAERIAATHADAGERLLATLRFVQREIRYLGVEIGPGSHAPGAPHAVLERRFGDCKDKSLLTMTLLQALGIEAKAALVHTSLRRGIREFAPTPFAFNHVLVRASVGGKHYWIDPTRSPQKGDLAHLYQPDFEAALVVDEGTRELVPMTGSKRTSPDRTIHTRYDAQGGAGQPVRYTVTSIFEGAAAEGMRDTLATANREDLQKRYLNYYARYHPELTVAEPMSVRDDDALNRLTLTEHYLIPDFWRRAEAHKRFEALIAVPEVDQYLRRPQQSIRVGPLALAHPVNLTHTTEVRLPDNWDLKPESTRIEDASFEFERKRTEKDRVLTLVDSFRSRADHVAPTETARYAASLERARNAVDLVLYRNDAAAAPAPRGFDRFNWPVATLAVLMLAGFGWLASKVYRHDPPARPYVAATPKLQGIAGWLLLPALATIVIPIRLLVDMSTLIPSYAADNWAALTTVGNSTYHAMWAPVLLFELAANLAYLVFALLLLVMFFQKRRGAPRLFIGVLAFSLLIRIVDYGLMHTIPGLEKEITDKDWKELVQSIVVLIVWGSYFTLSKRVQATFVNGFRDRDSTSFAPTQPAPLGATP